MKKSIIAISLLAFSVTAAVAATNQGSFAKKATPAQKKLQTAMRNELREYLRTDGLIEKVSAPSTNKAYTDEEVGDANSFGRAVNYIGTVQSGVLNIAADCTPDPSFPPGPNDHCITPDASNNTLFNFPDMGKVLIPGKSTKTLMCHWQTPFSTVIYANGTGVYQGTARAALTATYKIENEVLNNPALIDPSTGVAFGGSFTTSLGSFRDSRSLQPGETQVFRDNYTRVCLGGLISKRSLIETYGLTEDQATKFFKKDTTITIGMSGSTRFVSDASIIVGTRFVGD